jgi:O-antigen/teichoic acid export membrane protein
MSKNLSKIIGLTFIVQVAVYSLGIVNNALMSRWLGPALLGIVVLLLQISELIYKFTNLGQESSLLYFLSNKKYDREQVLGTSVTNAFFIIIISAFITLLFFYSGVIYLFFSEHANTIQFDKIWWCIFLIIAYLTFEYGTKILLGLQQFLRYNRYFPMRPLVLFILLLLVHYFWELDTESTLLVLGLSWITPALFMWRFALPLKLQWKKIVALDFFKYGAKINITSIFVFLSYRADIFFIGFFLSEEYVGWYYIGMVIAEKLHYLVTPTSTILFPAAAHSEDQQKKTPILLRINFAFIFITASILGISAHKLIPLIFSSQYVNSVDPLLLLLPGVVALTFSSILGADLSARGLPHIQMYITIFIFILKLIINIIAIPKIGMLGAALSATISYIVAAILIIYYYKKISGVAISKLLIPRISDLRKMRKI